MASFIPRSALTAVLLITSTLMPASSAPAQGFVEKSARAQRRVVTESFVRTELFFGTGKADGSAVTDEQWQTFLDEEVTPRFPDGLTVLAGIGQFRTSQGATIQERSFVLILLYPVAARKDADTKIEEIRDAYKARFEQESVLRVDDRRPAKISF